MIPKTSPTQGSLASTETQLESNQRKRADSDPAKRLRNEVNALSPMIPSILDKHRQFGNELETSLKELEDSIVESPGNSQQTGRLSGEFISVLNMPHPPTTTPANSRRNTKDGE